MHVLNFSQHLTFPTFCWQHVGSLLSHRHGFYNYLKKQLFPKESETLIEYFFLVSGSQEYSDLYIVASYCEPGPVNSFIN